MAQEQLRILAYATEAKGKGFKKAFVCSDPDLIKFALQRAVIDALEGAGLGL